MSTLAARIRRVSDLGERETERLRQLCSSWQVLADLSFSDLLLYVPVAEDEADMFEICAQLRPLTSQTLYPRDMIGRRVTQPEQPIVERAYREGLIWFQDDPVMVDGIPIRMDAVPVQFEGRVIAVVTKEGSPATTRRAARLEEVYLQGADGVSHMIAAGTFPFDETPAGDWPRVGEGLFVLDEEGRITWASPNALSSLHRLGIKHAVMGTLVDDLGTSDRPVNRALESRSLIDGELVHGDTFVRLRVLPLIDDDRPTGALVLARDETELRQKDRLISVKDATIREIHHRVKNNLQTIASLLRLQGRRVGSEEAKGALQESVLRIGSIALVHETLSEHPSDVAEFGEIARRIAHMVMEGLVLPDRTVEIKVTGSTGPLRAELATPLAVTLSELMQNAVEHAFPEGRGGTIGVELSHDDGGVAAVVWDDGVGLSGEPSKGSRLGLQIVRSLIDELGGTFALRSNGGTRAEIRVPVYPAP